MSPLSPLQSWFGLQGPSQEIALFSRVRVIRNVEGLVFSQDPQSELGRDLVRRVGEALTTFPVAKPPELLNLHDFSPLERRILLERQIFETGASYREYHPFFMTKEQDLSGVLLGQDHAKMACFSGGLDLWGAWKRLEPLDQHLEESLTFAISQRWGYLTSDPRQGGAAMKASVLMHLPGVEELSMVDRVYKTAESLGFQVRGFWGEGDSSLGDLYQISNQLSAGFSPEEILEGTTLLIEKIMKIETRARETMFQKRKVSFLDRVWRSYGILKYSYQIGYQEALSVLSSLRFGVIMGILKEFDLNKVTRLFYLVQKGHLALQWKGGMDLDDEKLYDFERIRWMRKYLDLSQGEDDHV